MDPDTFSKYVVPVLTFLLGLIVPLVTRFTFSAKEKHDIETQKVKTSTELSVEQRKAYDDFVEALGKYNSKTEKPDLDDFLNIARTGEAYFLRIKVTCDAIIAERVDINSIRNTHKPMIADTVNLLLPEYYETLRKISRENGFSFNGFLKRSSYMSIYEVNERIF